MFHKLGNNHPSVPKIEFSRFDRGREAPQTSKVVTFVGEDLLQHGQPLFSSSLEAQR